MTGIYSSAARLRTDGAADALAEADALGFDSLWIADVRADLPVLDLALHATKRMTVGSAVVSIWSVPAQELATWWAGRSRLRVGIGVSHGPLVPAYERPLASLRGYLDELDAAGMSPVDRWVGANGPKMLALTAARAAGAVTYMVTPEQTVAHRELLGGGPRLVPEVKVVLDRDLDAARTAARAHLAIYLTLPNYLGNLRRAGFTEADLTAPGSDRLIDALVAHGDEQAVLARVQEHLAAGADDVSLHVLSPDPVPLAAWRRLAAALITESAA